MPIGNPSATMPSVACTLTRGSGVITIEGPNGSLRITDKKIIRTLPDDGVREFPLKYICQQLEVISR